MNTCPDCANEVLAQAVFCDNCGYRLSQNNDPVLSSTGALSSDIGHGGRVAEYIHPGTCSSCGFENVPGEMFCQNCGVQLAPVASVPPPPPTPLDESLSERALSTPVETVACQVCGYNNSAEEQFCLGCGVQLASEVDVNPQDVSFAGQCPNCGFPNTSEGEYCKNCGLYLGAQIQTDHEGMVSQSALVDSKSCTYCGHPRTQGEQFCGNCGMQFGQSEAAYVEIIHQAPSAPDLHSVNQDPIDVSSDYCSNCGQPRQAEVEYCDNCGLHFQLSAPNQHTPNAVQASANISPDTAASIPGSLLLVGTHDEIVIPAGKTELLLGRSDPVRGVFPDIDFSTFGGDESGVSRSHAKLILTGSQVYIQDMNSTNFTFVNRQRLDPGQSHIINNGDEIRLGLLLLEYRR
jgi:hypothetical protein